MKEIRDQSLWHQLKNGNALAFRQLYDKHIDSLMAYGYKFTADRQVIEDCCQELFITIWQKREELPYMEKPVKYLFRAMRNNLVKKIQRIENRYIGGAKDYVFELVPSADKEIIQNEEVKEQSRKLHNALKELPSRQKEAIYLKYQKGLEYDEICEIMDINYQSARNLISRALTTLRDILGVSMYTFLKFFIEI